jgi:outer membrane protein TolC
MDQLAGVIFPAAARSLAQAREAYRAGRLMFLELVDAQRTFNDVTLRTMELRRNLAYAEADLMNLLGAGPYADNGEEQ